MEAMIFTLPCLYLTIQGTALVLTVLLLKNPTGGIATRINLHGNSWRFTSVLTSCGWLSIALGSALFLTYVGVGLYGFYSQDFLPGEWASIPIVLVIGAFLTFLGREELQLAELVDNGQWQNHAVVTRVRSILLLITGFVHLVILTALLFAYLSFLLSDFLVPIAFLLAIMIVCLPFGMAFLNAATVRTRQGHLLWCLTIALDQDISLSDEVEKFAGLLSGRARLEVLELVRSLRKGLDLSDALDQTDLLPKHAVVAARVGENTRDLAYAMRQSALHHTAGLSTATTGFSLSLFSIYYGAIIVAVECLVAFQMYFIVPKFKKIFYDFGTEVPPVTQSLIATSDFVISQFYIAVPIMAVPVIWILFTMVGYRQGWSNLQLNWLTRWFTRLDAPWVLRHVSLAVRSDCPVGEALGPVTLYHHRRHVRDLVERVWNGVRNGDDCWQLMGDEGILTNNEQALVIASERVGNLRWSLSTLADRIERAHEDLGHRCFALLRPVAVLLIGLGVAWVCIALFLPLIQLIGGNT
ncbi:MAG: hypothetical protein CMJ78_22065 [Planctomycetaceae bacterium]|nr:hypothetical protein [Planctomycetaceae bacterium]